MPDRIVVSNTSPLLYLHQIGHLTLLRDLYHRILVPPAVRDELRKGQLLGHSVPAIADHAWISVTPLTDTLLLPIVTDLGVGEAEAICLALSFPDSLLILDESLGRTVAERAGIELTGTLGVLVKAKRRGYLTEVKPALEALQATTMYLAPGLARRVLQMSGES